MARLMVGVDCSSGTGSLPFAGPRPVITSGKAEEAFGTCTAGVRRRASAERGLAGGHVGELGVMRRDPGEERPGTRVVAGPFLEVSERIPEPEVVLTWPLHGVGLAREEAHRLGDPSPVGERPRGDDTALRHQLPRRGRGSELLPEL